MTEYKFKYLSSQEELDQFGEIEKIEMKDPYKKIYPSDATEFDDVTIVYKNGVRVDLHAHECERIMFHAEISSDIPAEIRDQFKFKDD